MGGPVFEGPSMRTWRCDQRDCPSLERIGSQIIAYSLVIYYLNNDCKSTGVLTVCEQNNAADLDKPPLRRNNVDYRLPSHRVVQVATIDL